MEADSYPIDYLKCATTHTDLLKLRTLYKIPNDVLLTIPGKCDVPSRPPRGYVTLHLESFKLGARLPLQPYFVQILGGMHWLLVSFIRMGEGYSRACSCCGKCVSSGNPPF